MVSPNLIKRGDDDQPVEINDQIKKLFQIIYSESQKEKEPDEEEIASHLLAELIRARYLPNDKIPETKIKEIAVLLDKYIRLKDRVVAGLNAELNMKTDINRAKELLSEKNHFVGWFLKLAACEIEENLAPNPIRQTVVANLFSVLSKNIKLPADLPYNDDLEIQIYPSIGRKYLKLDEDMLAFVLFKYYNSGWVSLSRQEALTTADDAKIAALAEKTLALKALVKEQLNHPLAKQLDNITRLYSLYFSILTETVSADPVKVCGELERGERDFLAAIRKVCNRKYKKAKNRLWVSAVRSIIYIFLTKSVFAVLIEIPAISWLGQALNPLSLAINISFPAILLFFIVLSTRTPGETNTNKIVSGIKEIAFLGAEKKQPIILRKPARRNLLKHAIFNLLYAASFCLSVYVIVTVLTFINFNWVSITIFLFFLAFVSFFSIIVTKGVKELMVIERRENIFTFLVDLFYMPIILVGRWLSNNVSKVNVFIFIFDFIIEAPFKVIVEIGEDWTRYVRERREKMDN